MRGAQAVVECLKEHGVDTIFGYPGGMILPFYDALYDDKSINQILVTHEQNAAHAADGYARASGKVGVCVATSGPGATNLVTGIATAFMDSIPIVAITGQVDTSLLGRDAFQETDILDITMPVTKHNFKIKDARLLIPTLRQAFEIAMSGRRGPVLVDMPKDVQCGKCPFVYPQSCDIPGYRPVVKGHPGQIKRALQVLLTARRPLVYVGGGMNNTRASELLSEFVELTGFPVVETLMGIGAIDAANPKCLGLVGMHGSQASNMAVDACDLLIAVGCRFSDRVALKPSSFARNAKVVQIDIDRSEINKNVETAHHIIGDAKRVLQLLNERLEQQDHSAWKEYVFSFKTQTEYDEAADRMTPSQVLDAIARIAPKNAIFTTDVGQHQMWAIQHFHYDYPGQLLTSGGFGTMGFGLGAAIGAKVSHPDKVVLQITGDGCFRMNCHELATVAYYNLPIITILFNNGTLGMVRQWQTLIYDHRYCETDIAVEPDYVKLAEAYGLSGRRVSNQADFEEALREALSCGHGYVIDCVIDTDEMVKPMVGGGSHITEFLLRD